MFNRIEQMKLREVMEKFPDLLLRLEKLEAGNSSADADLDFFHELRDSVVKDITDANKKSG